MKSRLLLVLTLAFLSMISHATYASDQTSKYYLFTAKIMSVSANSEGVEPDGSDNIAIRRIYTVKLRVIEILNGNKDLPDTIIVKMIATHREAISKSTKIHMLLEMYTDASLHVLHWGYPQSIVCVPESYLAEAGIRSRVATYRRYDGQMCRSSEVNR